MRDALYVGLMSGTSLDGVDGVLARFSEDGKGIPAILAHAHLDFPDELRAELAALNVAGNDEIHRGALAANALATRYAQTTARLLEQGAVATRDVVAIGCHGQTVRHRPGEFDGVGYTVQLNAPALLAERSGIDVVADFRSRDVAAGGQGAPLAPAFHRAFFGRPERSVVALNLGGIANVTYLPTAGHGTVLGFDCGPANGLLDLWAERKTGQRYDAGGQLAASGRVDSRLLAVLRAEPYFARPVPKSTGRDLFNAAWLDTALRAAEAATRLDVAAIQATLAEFTASTCADAIRSFASDASEVIACGGGVYNDDLLRRLRALLAPSNVLTSDDRGLPAELIEASGFAWLARAFTVREAAGIASVSGASGARLLGALYPAS
ncbi:MAG: anhydro-N-acetylmuramic acid kinase [Pseudomonadota bacterium]|nr:anhydro-N-acetylmuramic acid kinase [Pseudomonadota bacterium]